MKKSILITLALVFGLSIAYATPGEGLKGPAAKNAKPWKNKRSNNNKATANIPMERLTGPTVKNQKPWNKEGKDLTEKKITRITGPKAKNSKPWAK